MKNKNFLILSFDYWFRLYFKYRSHFFFSFFSELAIPVIINILFVVGLSGSRLEARQIMDVVFYLMIANITYTITVTDLERIISSDIKSAKLIYKLLEPVSPCKNYVISDVAAKTLRMLLFYFPAALLLALFGRIRWMQVLCAIPFLAIANVMGYCLSFIIGCLSFWLTETWGISAVKNLLLAVFAGTVFPLSYLSDQWQMILFTTPFPYLSYIPSAFLLGELEYFHIRTLLLLGGIWCTAFMLLAGIVWSAGRKKYESVGV